MSMETIVPSHLILEVSGYCNYACIMCERQIYQPNRWMDIGNFIVARESLIPHIPCTELSGLGEPSLHPFIDMMVRDVQSFGNILYIPTNGSRLRTRWWESAENSDRTRIEVSIDAATPETYKKVRINGKWDELWEGVRLFRKARDKARMTSTFTAGAYNVDEFPAFVKKAAEEGFDEVDFKAVRAWVKRPEDISLRYRKERTMKAIAEATETAKSEGLILRIEPIPFAEGFENSGDSAGFVSYLDIIGLGTDPCGGASTVSSGSSGACYAGDMLIPLANGRKKRADKIKEGDFLDCYNHYGEFVKGRVAKVLKSRANVLTVSFSEGGAERVSPDHLFSVQLPDVVVPAYSLKPGDKVAAKDRTLTVESVESGGEEDVYTFAFGNEIAGWIGPLTVASSKQTLTTQTGTSQTSMPESLEPMAYGEKRSGIHVLQAPPLPRKTPEQPQQTHGVLLVTYDGTVCSCAARHPIGKLGQSFEEIVGNPDYQRHLRSRAGGEHNKSPWCRECERMI